MCILKRKTIVMNSHNSWRTIMYDRILVAIDDSDTSHSALYEAIKLAEKINAKLFVLHVADESFIYYGGPGFDCGAVVTLIKEEAKKVINNAKEILVKHPTLHYETVLFEHKAITGRVAEAIVEQAEELAIDLLVLGTHGRRGFSRLFIGSVAENVIRLTTIPVLLIKNSGT